MIGYLNEFFGSFLGAIPKDTHYGVYAKCVESLEVIDGRELAEGIRQGEGRGSALAVVPEQIRQLCAPEKRVLPESLLGKAIAYRRN